MITEEHELKYIGTEIELELPNILYSTSNPVKDIVFTPEYQFSPSQYNSNFSEESSQFFITILSSVISVKNTASICV